MSECRSRALERRPEETLLGRLGAAFVVVGVARCRRSSTDVDERSRARAGLAVEAGPPRQPFPAGRGGRRACRTLAPPLGEALGQRSWWRPAPARAGMSAWRFVAKAPANGYTLGMGSIGTHGINERLRAHALRPGARLSPITFVASNVNVLVVHPSVPANDSPARRLRQGEPGQASVRLGWRGHLAASRRRAVQADHRHGNRHDVPYHGAGPAVTDLLGGRSGSCSSTSPRRSRTFARKAARARRPDAGAHAAPRRSHSDRAGHCRVRRQRVVFGLFAPAARRASWSHA